MWITKLQYIHEFFHKCNKLLEFYNLFMESNLYFNENKAFIIEDFSLYWYYKTSSKIDTRVYFICG